MLREQEMSAYPMIQRDRGKPARSSSPVQIDRETVCDLEVVTEGDDVTDYSNWE